MNVAALLRCCAMGHNPLDGVALILRPLFVCLSCYKFSKVGVANTSAGHPTLLKKGGHTFPYSSLRKGISVVLNEELRNSRVSEGRPYFGDMWPCQLALLRPYPAWRARPLSSYVLERG